MRGASVGPGPGAGDSVKLAAASSSAGRREQRGRRGRDTGKAASPGGEKAEKEDHRGDLEKRE